MFSFAEIPFKMVPFQLASARNGAPGSYEPPAVGGCDPSNGLNYDSPLVQELHNIQCETL